MQPENNTSEIPNTEQQPMTEEKSTPAVKKSPLEMVKLGVDQIVGKLSRFKSKPNNVPISDTSAYVPPQTPADVQIPAAQQVNQPISPKVSKKLPKKMLLVGLGVFVLAIVGLALVANMLKVPIPNPLAEPTPEATASPVAATPVPSKYANDPAVLKLENDIKTLDEELINVDLDEDVLKPRPLKWDITF